MSAPKGRAVRDASESAAAPDEIMGGVVRDLALRAAPTSHLIGFLMTLKAMAPGKARDERLAAVEREIDRRVPA
jgi:hypothetical protein